MFQNVFNSVNLQLSIVIFRMGDLIEVNKFFVAFIFILQTHGYFGNTNTKSDVPRQTGTFYSSKDGDFLRVFGQATLTHLKECSPQSSSPHCRTKRDGSSQPVVLTIRLETPKVVFQHQRDSASEEFGNEDLIKPIIVSLHQSGPTLVGPNYKLVVRGENSEILTFNETRPEPDCHYSGTVDNLPDSKVAFSICDNKLKGVIHSDETKLIIESLDETHPEFHRVDKRETFGRKSKTSNLVLVYESRASGGECGLKSENLKRMSAPQPVAVVLNTSTEDRTKRSNDENFIGRSKRSTLGEKTIELAVFVDEVLYGLTKSKGTSEPINAIQDIVFTYLNSVQILYYTVELDVKVRFVLVRLEVFTAAQKDIDKKGGEIEGYLESFCQWQQQQNPDSWDSKSNNPDHWDHGLLLTGMNLFDGKPEFDSVIGLAWVAGMCNPSYSCTINEGNNFESVYVIAHEMGHNLGMNHDGEKREGNFCDPDLYLMSPVLGPGKVTWSTCSNKELTNFLTTHPLTVCLDDKHSPQPRYDYLKDGSSPGEKYNALAQCQLAFGNSFKPHLKEEAPFENLCRELWCANSTHALRAHPALEGTDCSAKPYPYGSYCIRGKCVPFFPNGIKGDETLNSNTLPFKKSDAGGKSTKMEDVRPEWYDPIFTKIFVALKNKVAEKHHFLNFDG